MREGWDSVENILYSTFSLAWYIQFFSSVIFSIESITVFYKYYGENELYSGTGVHTKNVGKGASL